MIAHTDNRAEWLAANERGSTTIIKLAARMALRIGRPLARCMLYPICAYYLAFSPKSRAASREYLARALDRRPTGGDLFRHYHTFAGCLLDRVFFLSGRTHLFDLRIHGVENIAGLLRHETGGFLFGAHMGSFDAVRAPARGLGGLRVALAMYEENSRKIRSMVDAVNPDLAADIIGLGRHGAMIEVKDRLDQGYLVGMLADRSLTGDGCIPHQFLGAPARFPVGPFRLAAVLRRPVVLMVGLYRGGRRYDIHFETLTDLSEVPPGDRDKAIGEAMRHYVARLEHYCRSAPYNWFNFYNFWK